MTTLTALVVDDEPLARQRLGRLLTEAGCRVVGELHNGAELLCWLAEGTFVDVVFLDIQMPGLSGLEVLAEHPDMPPVVFVTAYSEHAVRAFELAAMDYLLKPVFADRLARCLSRLRMLAVAPLSPSALGAVLPIKRFPVRAGSGELFMDLEKITHFQLEDERVWAWRVKGHFLTKWASLAEVEQAFPGDGMLRIQRHLLLRPSMVKGVRSLPLGRMKVLVAPQVELIVSRSKTPETREALRKFFVVR